MLYTKPEMIALAVQGAKALGKPRGTEAILILFEPSSGAIGWASTVEGPEMLSVVSDVLDEIICQEK